MMNLPVKWDKPGDKGTVMATMIGIGQSGSGDLTRPVAIVVEDTSGRMAFVDFRYITVCRDKNAID